MRWSDERILTTHTGSLPRPPHLTDLYVRRARGEAIDAGEIAEAGRRAVRAAVQKQAEAGIDVGNNGEQQRESFFLYLRDRLTGLGGSWERTSRADVDRYPVFRQMWNEQHAAKVQISSFNKLPKAVGAVSYKDAGAIRAECEDFQAILKETAGAFREAFMTAPSPGILAATIFNEYYDGQAAYLRALGTALQVEYEAIVAHGFILQIDAPDLALERHISYKDRPLKDLVAFVENVVATINAALVNGDPSVFRVGGVQLNVAEPVATATTVTLKAAREVLTVPSLTLITMLLVVPTLLGPGVP